MKRLFLTILLVYFAIIVSPQIYQTIDIPREEIRLKEKGIYHKIEYGYSSYSDSIGYHDIPVIQKSYAIPLDAANLALQIITCKTDTLYTGITLYSVSLAFSILSAASLSLAAISRKAFTKIVISPGLNWAGLPFTS